MKKLDASFMASVALSNAMATRFFHNAGVHTGPYFPEKSDV